MLAWDHLQSSYLSNKEMEFQAVGVTFYHKVCSRIKTQSQVFRTKLSTLYHSFPLASIPGTHQKLQDQGTKFAIFYLENVIRLSVSMIVCGINWNVKQLTDFPISTQDKVIIIQSKHPYPSMSVTNYICQSFSFVVGGYIWFLLSSGLALVVKDKLGIAILNFSSWLCSNPHSRFYSN